MREDAVVTSGWSEPFKADRFHSPEPGDVEPGTPAWRQFELDVKEHIAGRYPNVTVSHNRKMLGDISGRDRQVDVLIEATVAGEPIQIVVECKRNMTSPIKIGTVDAFAGRLQDVGAERGVLWCFGGYDVGAKARADGATNPKIALRTPADFEANHEIPASFFNPCDCPNDNCYGGEIDWQRYVGDESGRVLKAGYCGCCGTFAGRCPDSECEEITALDGGSWSCFGCEAVWSVTFWHDGGTWVDWEPATSQ